MKVSVDANEPPTLLWMENNFYCWKCSNYRGWKLLLEVKVITYKLCFFFLVEKAYSLLHNIESYWPRYKVVFSDHMKGKSNFIWLLASRTLNVTTLNHFEEFTCYHVSKVKVDWQWTSASPAILNGSCRRSRQCRHNVNISRLTILSSPSTD